MIAATPPTLVAVAGLYKSSRAATRADVAATRADIAARSVEPNGSNQTVMHTVEQTQRRLNEFINQSLSWQATHDLKHEADDIKATVRSVGE